MLCPSRCIPGEGATQLRTKPCRLEPPAVLPCGLWRCAHGKTSANPGLTCRKMSVFCAALAPVFIVSWHLAAPWIASKNTAFSSDLEMPTRQAALPLLLSTPSMSSATTVRTPEWTKGLPSVYIEIQSIAWHVVEAQTFDGFSPVCCVTGDRIILRSANRLMWPSVHISSLYARDARATASI